MSISLKSTAHKISLEQSERYGNDYKLAYESSTNEAQTINDLSVDNLANWYDAITFKYPFIHGAMGHTFGLFVDSLITHLDKINPSEIEGINDDCIEEEEELLIWRETHRGISKLIFDQYGQVSYVFNGNDGSKKRGVFDHTVDFERLIFQFLMF